MAEQKESSVLFSLKELMNLEEDRIRQEENERKRQEEAALQARMDAERRVREEEEAKTRAADKAKQEAESRAREEATRLEGIRQAEIERARLDAENAARLEQMKRQQEHERQIVALSQDKSKKNLTLIAGGSAAFLLIALVGGGFAIKNSLDRQKALETQLNDLNGANDELAKKLSGATTPEERARLEAEIAANKEAMSNLQKNPEQAATKPAVVHRPSGPAAKPNTPSGPAKPCNCTPGDPLCSCL